MLRAQATRLQGIREDIVGIYRDTRGELAQVMDDIIKDMEDQEVQGMV